MPPRKDKKQEVKQDVIVIPGGDSDAVSSTAPPRPSVHVVQVDSRPVCDRVKAQLRMWRGGSDKDAMRQVLSTPPPQRPYWAMSALCNAYQAKQGGMSYSYNVVELKDRHASWSKVAWILSPQLAKVSDSDWVVVVDADAWIRDVVGLKALLAASEKPVLVSGGVEGAVIGSGFLAFRKEGAVVELFKTMWDACRGPEESMTDSLNVAYTDLQDRIEVLPLVTANTPSGSMVSHCWYKDLMYDLVLDDLLGSMAEDLLDVPKPSIEFVVCRYDEPVDWIFDWLPFINRATVYNKGSKLSLPVHPKVTVKEVPNHGREAEAYARHCVQNYDSLCEQVVFTQANWSEHMSPEDFEHMVKTGHRTGQVTGMDIPWTSGLMDRLGWTTDVNFPRRDGSHVPMQPSGKSFAKLFYTVLAGPDSDIVPESEVLWYPGAIMSVTKAKIRAHPMLVYQKIKDEVSVGANPEAAFMFERLWALFWAL